MKKVFHIVSNKEWGGGEQYVYDLAQRQMADAVLQARQGRHLEVRGIEHTHTPPVA